MREIKFRAWDNQTNSWFQNGDGFALSWDATAIIDDMDEVYYTRDRIVFQQFTGLKDKNGKEIYEGDILGSSGRVIGHIEGGVRGYCYDLVYLNPTDDKRWSLYACIETDYQGDVEVIGNIYENKNLLSNPEP